MPDPAIHVSKVGNVRVVSLVGEHDVATADDLRRALIDPDADDVGIVVDLAGAQFVDSAIVSVLAEGYRAARGAGRGYVCALPDETGIAVRRLFGVARLDTLFAVRPTVEAAIEAAGEGLSGPAA
jgi:anti-anti-sigma factor